MAISEIQASFFAVRHNYALSRQKKITFYPQRPLYISLRFSLSKSVLPVHLWLTRLLTVIRQIGPLSFGELCIIFPTN